MVVLQKANVRYEFIRTECGNCVRRYESGRVVLQCQRTM